MQNNWHDISELPEHDGWIWISTGTKQLGSKIKSIFYKKDCEHMHGFQQLRDIKLGVNYARYWMWQIPIIQQKDN